MSLGIFLSSGGEGLVSQEGEMTNPMRFIVSADGGNQEMRVFLRSTLPAQEAIADGLLYAHDGIRPDESWIKFAPDINGAAGEYASTLAFNIPLNSELPVWIRVLVPDAAEQGLKTDIKIATRYIGVAS